MKKYSAAYILAFHFGWDARDMSDQRYQSTRFVSPAVYTIGNDYYCVPPAGSAKLPIDREIADRWDWKPLAEHYGRKIFWAKG